MLRNTQNEMDAIRPHAAEAQPDQHEMVKQAPWLAISFAAHAVLLLLFWSVVLAKSIEEIIHASPLAVEPNELPEPPPIQPNRVWNEDRQDPDVQEPTEDPRISQVANDDHSEDPTNNPNEHSLRPSESHDDSRVESPSPEKNFNSAIGIGGKIGGGNGPAGGDGGFHYRRARGNGPGKAGRDPRPDDKNMLAALRWLRDHQNADGSWDAVKFADAGRAHGRAGAYGNLDRSADTGWEHAECGVSGLALLAFLGAGYTHQEGEFQLTVRNGMKYLRAVQDNDGIFDTTLKANHHYVYGHAICAMAIAEAYAMTGSLALRGPAQKGVDFIVTAQNIDPDRGPLGWRYGIKPGDSDASVTGWMVLALKSARVAGLDIPEQCWSGAKTQLDDLTGEFAGYPKTGYTIRAGQNARLQGQARFLPNESMSAINILAQVFMDSSLLNSPTIKAQAGRIIEPDSLPTLENPDKIDYYYWYYGALAMRQMGGNFWKTWEKAMVDVLVKSQRLEGGESNATYGSWDSTDAWGVAGGRVYATAINCLSLQAPYRYAQVGKHDSK